MLHLGDELTPEVEGEVVCSAAERRQKMIFPCLDGFFGYVSAMIIGWYQLVGHGGGGDGFSVGS